MPFHPTSPALAAAVAPAEDALEQKAARKAAKRAAASAGFEAEVTPAAVREEAAAKQQAAEEKAARKAARKLAAAAAAAAEVGADDEMAVGTKGGKREASPSAEEPKKKIRHARPACDVAEAAAQVAGGVSSTFAEAYRRKHMITSAEEGQTLPDPVQTFDNAPFDDAVRLALRAAGFNEPSPIQAQSWPIAVQGSDIVAVAKTGSGKTLAFLLPAFRHLAKHRRDRWSSGGVAEPGVLVLAPTRELAVQIEEQCVKFGDSVKVTSTVVYGGAPKGPQAQALKKGPQVVVATPGRLQDFMEMGTLNLKQVDFLVLDEADRMLDMGFEPEIAKIISTMPVTRQTMLFTATWPKAVMKIATKYLKKEYLHVNVGSTEELAANTAVTQEFYALGDDEKEEKLWRLLDAMPENAKVICFANTKRRIIQLTKNFQGRGYGTAALHGDMPQRDRDQQLQEFTSGKSWLMFGTDVCARGLDVKDVTHVFNYDMARDVEQYVHRIGRTGRAGSSGTSVTFWNEAYDKECAPALAKIAREAGQDVPLWLDAAATKQKDVKNKGWRY